MARSSRAMTWFTGDATRTVKISESFLPPGGPVLFFKKEALSCLISGMTGGLGAGYAAEDGADGHAEAGEVAAAEDVAGHDFAAGP